MTDEVTGDGLVFDLGPKKSAKFRVRVKRIEPSDPRYWPYFVMRRVSDGSGSGANILLHDPPAC